MRLARSWLAQPPSTLHHLAPPVQPSRSPNFARLSDKWMSDLQNLIESFHANGLVHGDLREANMLCEEEKVMLLVIDFDWVPVPGSGSGRHIIQLHDSAPSRWMIEIALRKKMMSGSCPRVINALMYTVIDSRRLRLSAQRISAILPVYISNHGTAPWSIRLL